MALYDMSSNICLFSSKNTVAKTQKASVNMHRRNFQYQFNILLLKINNCI